MPEVLLQQRRQIGQPVQVLAEAVVQIMPDLLPLPLADFQQLPLQPLALRDVPHHREVLPPPAVGEIADGQLQHDPAAVLAPAQDFASDAHEPLVASLPVMREEILPLRLDR